MAWGLLINKRGFARGFIALTAVIWENASIAGTEVECACVRIANKDGGSGMALMKIKPFFGLQIL